MRIGPIDISRRKVERKQLEDWPWSSPPPESWLLGGGSLNLERAVGLPALLAVLKRIAEGVGMMPQLVYEGEAPSRRRAVDTWQWDLLHRRPSSEATPFPFRADVALSVAGHGYACVRKFKVRGRVGELIPLDATKVKPRRVGGRLVFEDSTDGQTVTRDQSEIIYVRGMAMNGSVAGVAPITAARTHFATGLKRQSFEGTYYDKSAEPRIVLSFPEQTTKDKALEWKQAWDVAHGGPENWHSTSVIGGGAEVKPIPVSLEDAQFVESHRLTVEQTGAIYGVPKAILNVGDNSPTDADRMHFVTFGLGWILVAIDQAFSADPDLFPPGSGLMCEHLADALLRPDTRTRYEAYKAARQAGWLTANEIRALENYPPLPGGDELQATPVGGAPNKDALDAALILLSGMTVAAVPEQRQIIAKVLERATVRNGDGTSTEELEELLT